MPEQIQSEEELADQVQRAADGDWKAAAWLLANAPLTRAEWGDGAAVRQALQQQRRSFVGVVDQVDLTAEQRAALLQGLAALPLEPEAFVVDSDPDDVDLLGLGA